MQKKSSTSSCQDYYQQIVKKGVENDQLPVNSLIIDIVFEIENIPKFVSNGNYISKYDKLIDLHQWISEQVALNKINYDNITPDLFDRLFGIYVSQLIQNW